MTKLIFCCNDYRAKDGYIAPHSHECHEIVFYGDTAKGETEIGGTGYVFAPGSVALIHQNTLHSEHHLESTDVIFFGFESRILLPDGVWNDMKELKSLFYDIVEEIRNQEWGYEKIISLKIQEILALLERKNTKESSCVKNLAYCKRYIEENYHEKITLEQLAETSNLNKYYLSHKFAELYGKPPIAYLTQVRIMMCKDLLKTTDHCIVEIAEMTGFSSGSYFSQTFRRLCHMSPQKYRKLHKE